MTENNFIKTTAIKKIELLKKRKKVIQGGTSAGKTFGIIPLLIDYAIKNPMTEISIVAESYPHLRRGAMKDFLKIMVMTNRFTPDRWNKTGSRYRFHNKSYIEFFSVDQEQKVRGARRNVLYVNEANNIDFETYNQLAIRTDGDIYLDYNPTAEFWAHTEIADQDDSDFI
jgi:phage terminase large subunit